MRIDRLELIRYGKFTDLAIDLPRAERDFHVIVGPNEAGKSTVRSAILDLLYGFPKSTAYAFVHPMPDLRLGATIEHNGETLEFHRTKGYKATLRTPKDGNSGTEAYFASSVLSLSRLANNGQTRRVRSRRSRLTLSNLSVCWAFSRRSARPSTEECASAQSFVRSVADFRAILARSNASSA